MLAIAKDKGLHRFEWLDSRANGTNLVAEVTRELVEHNSDIDTDRPVNRQHEMPATNQKEMFMKTPRNPS